MQNVNNSKDGLYRVTSLLDRDEPRRRVLIDFDFTLFLSNSTEEFLGSAKPAFLAVLILKILALFKPWFLLSPQHGYSIWRDAIRVWTIIILMPWTLLLFKNKAPAIFNQYLNQDLAKPLEKVKKQDTIIISFGFKFIIQQLIAGSSFANANLVSSSIWRPTQLRQQGKLKYLASNGIEIDSEIDIFITDSDKDDADLLTEFRNSFHIQWPNEKTEGAHEGVYVPFYYLANIKRSPEFFIKTTLLEELPVFVLAFLLFQPLQWGTIIGGLLLFLAFLIIYETGYHENDHVGNNYEKSPKLSKEFLRQKSYQVEPYAWYWLIAVTSIAILFLDQETISTSLARVGVSADHLLLSGKATIFGFWIVTALMVRMVFFLFNHVPLVWRIFVFFPLHVLKYFSPLVIFSIQPAGIALLSAQVIRTWSAYAIRRCNGDELFVVSQLIRLMFLVFLLLIFSLLLSFEEVFLSWQTWVIIIWCFIRAVPEMNRKLFHHTVRSEFVPWKKNTSSPKRSK